MNKTCAGLPIRYLPVEINGEVFGILLDHVAYVGSFQELRVPDGQGTGESVSVDPNGSVIPVVDIARLFWGEAQKAGNPFSVIVSPYGQMCALLVDRVRPLQTAGPASQFPIPAILRLGLLFYCVVETDSGLVPIINTETLARQAGLSTPEYTQEAAHAA